MKIKKRRSIIKLSILILILGFLSYSFGYMPIIGDLIAEQKLSEYYTVTKDKPYSIKAEYDWYNTQYKAINRDVTYSLQSNTIHDGYMTKEVNEKANRQYKKIKKEFSENLIMPFQIDIWNNINANDYSIKSQRLYILSIYNTEDISEEDSEKMPATIADKVIKLMGEDYNFTGIQIIYYDKNGGYESAIPAHGFKKLEYDEILSKTKKVDRLPEDYLDWLSKQ